jgi:hypothetical protein
MPTFAQKQNPPQKLVSSNLIRSKMSPSGSNHYTHPVLHLQRTIGNQAVQRMLQTHTEEPDVGLTAAASPRFGHDFSQIPIHSPAAETIQKPLQTKGASSANAETALDVTAAAGSATHLQRKCHCDTGIGSTPCAACGERARLPIQREASREKLGADLEGALAQGGQALPAPIRQRVEPLLGADFSSVRVHDDSASHRAATGLAARAFTVGQHIHFGSGEYRPTEPDGIRLMAHELAHTIQQTSGGLAVAPTPMTVAAAQSPLEREADHVAAAVMAGRAASARLSLGAGAVQRQQTVPTARVDVAIVLTDSDQDMSEGRARASIVLRVTDPEDARDKLKALGKPIGTLYVVSHSNAEGKVEFISSIGTISWTPISSLGATLKQGFAAGMEPVTVDFGGCKVGAAGIELEAFRSAVGSQSAKSTNCWSFSAHVSPLTFGGDDITSPSQIPQSAQKRFDHALLKQLDGLKAKNGVSVKNCLIGLAPGETFNAANLKKVWAIYWANAGNLVAIWNSPQYSENWQKESICRKDMTEATKPCSVVEKTAPPASATKPPAGSGTTAPAAGSGQQVPAGGRH